MNNIKAIMLSVVTMISGLMPGVTHAHSSSSFASQMVHTMLNAHHAFGGLLFIAIVVLALKVRKKLATNRRQQKR